MFSFIIFNILLFQCSKLYPLEDGTPSSYLLYIFNGEYCDASNPKGDFFFFWVIRQVCRDRESLSRHNSFVAQTSLSCARPDLVCAPKALSLRAQALSYARLGSCHSKPRPCRANSVATRLCHVATRLPCLDPNSVMT